MVANALSPTPKPMVIARSSSSIDCAPPGGKTARDWLTFAIVGHGNFTVKSDAAKLGPVLQRLIEARKSQAKAAGDMTFYRLLHSFTERLCDGTSVETRRETYDEWMASMCFSSAREGEKSGLCPLRFAAIAGRDDIVKTLLELGADVECPLKVAVPPINFVKGQRIIGAVALFRDCPKVIECLLNHGADPARIQEAETGCNALANASISGRSGSIAALLAHAPQLQHATGKFGIMPTNYTILYGHHEAAFRLRDTYPDLWAAMLEQQPNTLGEGLCGATILSSGDGEMIDALLKLRDPEAARQLANDVGPARKDAKGLFFLLDMIQRLVPFNGGLLGAFAFAFRSTALHGACYTGNLGALRILLSHGADFNSTANPKRMTPLALAALAGHIDIVKELLGAGALTALKDKRGRTAAAWATKHGHHEIARLIAAGPPLRSVLATSSTANPWLIKE